MSSIAQYFDPAQWSAAGFGSRAFWAAVPQIALVNVLLSGDTAVVIAMACRGLPPRQRPWGVALGAGTATVLLIIFAAVIAPLLQFPYIKLIGGLALIYIAVKLLIPENPGSSNVEAPTQVWRVARVVALADIVLSLDNVIAVAAVARGDLGLLAIGVAISIPIMFVGAALIMALFERFPVFVWAGAAMLGWIGGQTIATDPAVSRYLVADFGERFADRAAIAAAGIGLALVIASGALLRRR